MASFSIDEYIVKIDQFLGALESNIPSITLRLGLAALADVKNRIIEFGVDSNGNAVPGYSETPVPAFFYFDKSPTSAGRAFIEEKSAAGELVSYKEFREVNSRPTEHKTYSFTGRMWADVGPVFTGKTGKNLYLVEITGRTQETRDLLLYNSVRDGIDLLGVTIPEQAELQRQGDIDLTRLVKQYLE